MDRYGVPPVAGPGPIGHSVAIARGTYSEILSIDAPDSASPGDMITVEVRVQSFYYVPIYIAVTSRYNGVDLFFSPDYALLDTYDVGTFIASFIMPSNEIRLDVWSFYWAEPEWIQDDANYIDIALAEVFEGTINRKELEYDGDRVSIPAPEIAYGLRGLAHIWGRNDTAEAQRMGIHWLITDPGSLVVEEYSSWESWPYTGAGGDHEFIGGRFDLDKEGSYRLEVELMMNPDDPVVVDTYVGILCSVGAPPVLAGTITSVALEYDSNTAEAPVIDIPYGLSGLVHVWGRNDSIESQKVGISWLVTDPDGIIVEEYSDWEIGQTSPGEEHQFIGGRFNLDKVGSYSISIELLMEGAAAPVAVARIGNELGVGVSV